MVDPNTTLIKFKVPAPRFFYHMLTYKYDIGLHIVPKHIFEGQDWTTFAAFDLAKGWPVTTGPWKVVNVSPTQKVFDRRDSWWGVAAGVGKLPEVERIVLLPDAGEQQLAQGLISNAVDFSTGLQVATFPTVFDGNPNITTFTGKELPWGNVDWWPTSLYLNCKRAPFDNPKFRWAVSYMIDRQTLIDVGWGGCVEPVAAADAGRRRLQGTRALLRVGEAAAREVSDQRVQSGQGRRAHGRSSAGRRAATASTRTRPASRSRSRSSASSTSRRSGRCWSSCCAARASTPPTASRRTCSTASSPAISMPRSSATAAASAIPTRRCASTSRRHRRCPAARRSTWSTSRSWNNKEYDLIADEMFRTAPTETAKMQELWLKAMEIWLPELPDVQLMQFYHRLPMNLTYWKGYPTKNNPYVNPAFFHSTYALVLHNLEAVT